MAQPPQDFAHTVVPILRSHCAECHGGREARGSFSINTRELLTGSGHVVAGKPQESHLLSLVTSDDAEIQMPPKDKPRLSDEEIVVLRKWILDGLPWDEGFSFAPETYEPPLKPRRPELPAPHSGRNNPVDRLLDHYFAAREQPYPLPISDAAFLRRVSLDLVGLLPEPESLVAFLADTRPDKRDLKIRELLNDNVAWAEHWLSFYNDLLRNDYSGTGFITGGRQQISGWLYESLVANKPFDQFTRELIAPPSPASRGYIDGIRWRGEVSAGQTVEIQFAQSVSQSFLGINLKCASCHNSFIDRWTLDEAYGLAAIYSERPLQIHRCDKPIGREAVAGWLFPELGQIDAQAARDERLRQLAALMTHPENGRFSRTIVNRLWYRMMGRGIVHPLDAMQSEPWNADLLDLLATHLTDSRYDVKEVLFLIASSQAYQSETAGQSPESGDGPDSSAGSAADDHSGYVYRGPETRRMTAEQFLDSVWQITGAAPLSFDAPVIRGAPSDVSSSATALPGEWIWGDSAREGSIPPAGEVLTLRTEFTLPDHVDQGGIVLTCDNEFTLFVNGREVRKGTDWTRPETVPVRDLLRKGGNIIMVLAGNGGNTPNPAGLYLEARIRLADGQTVSISSDASWEWNPGRPSVREGRAGQVPGEWKPVTVVPALPVWQQAVESTVPGLLTQALNGNFRMVRASLLKNDFLMKSLGRPLREQIVSMRPGELTTLEAINLSNGPALAKILGDGARFILNNENGAWSDNRSEIVSRLCVFAFSRNPTEEEHQIAMEFLSDPPQQREIEDLLWAIIMTPEFLLVR